MAETRSGSGRLSRLATGPKGHARKSCRPCGKSRQWDSIAACAALESDVTHISGFERNFCCCQRRSTIMSSPTIPFGSSAGGRSIREQRTGTRDRGPAPQTKALHCNPLTKVRIEGKRLFAALETLAPRPAGLARHRNEGQEMEPAISRHEREDLQQPRASHEAVDSWT